MDKTTRNIVLAVATLSGFVATFAASGIVVATKQIGDEFHLSAVVLVLDTAHLRAGRRGHPHGHGQASPTSSAA